MIGYSTPTIPSLNNKSSLAFINICTCHRVIQGNKTIGALKYSFRFLRKQPTRTLFTIAVGSLCAVLILFLMSIYRGVEVGSMNYIRYNNADLWVLQEGVTNIMRGSSILLSAHGDALNRVEGVSSISPVLFVLGQAKANGHESTVEVVGYSPISRFGGPPKIISGRNVNSDGEIVLDRSFAAKCDIGVGDSIIIHRQKLRVVGISTGTNMFVIQYAFTTMEQARIILGYPSVVSCYLVKISNRVSALAIAKQISENDPGVDVYTTADFDKNNLIEMRAGFLPILWIISFISTFVLVAILTAILTMNITESRKNFAVLKALGSPPSFLPRYIRGQATILSVSGSLLSLLVFFPVSSLLERLVPELSMETSVQQVIILQIISLVIGFVSSVISGRRLRKIYSLEAFT